MVHIDTVCMIAKNVNIGQPCTSHKDVISPGFAREKKGRNNSRVHWNVDKGHFEAAKNVDMAAVY